jgi:ArsR family metal-binding transcriptional regulator
MFEGGDFKLNLTKKEQVEKQIASGKLHVNKTQDTELTEEEVEDIFDFINFVKEKNKMKGAKNNAR